MNACFIVVSGLKHILVPLQDFVINSSFVVWLLRRRLLLPLQILYVLRPNNAVRDIVHIIYIYTVSIFVLYLSIIAMYAHHLVRKMYLVSIYWLYVPI